MIGIERKLVYHEDMEETIKNSVICGINNIVGDSSVIQEYIATEIVLVTLPETRTVCTGYGSAKVDVFVNQEINKNIISHRGHGRYLVVSDGIINGLLANRK